MKNLLIFILTIMLIVFSGCKTLQTEIRESFKPRYETASLAFQFHYVIRTEYVKPEVFYLLNLKTFELYPMKQDMDSILYIDQIPLGEYQIGFFIGNYDVAKVQFKIFNYSNYKIRLPKKGQYSLGRFFYKFNVESLKVFPVGEGFTGIQLGQKKYSSYITQTPFKDLTDDINSPVFKEYEFGKGRYLNESPEELHNDLVRASQIEKNRITGEIKKIRTLYETSPEEALNLCKNLFKSTNNLNYLAETGILHYRQDDLEKAELYLNQLLDRDPNAAEYYGFQGLVHYRNHRNKEAFDFLYRSIAFSVQWGAVYDAMAQLLFEEKNIKMARLVSEYSLKLEPDNPDFKSTLARINQETQR